MDECGSLLKGRYKTLMSEGIYCGTHSWAEGLGVLAINWRLVQASFVPDINKMNHISATIHLLQLLQSVCWRLQTV